MMPFVKRIFQHELISGSTYMFVGSMVANICGFLFNLILARHLSTINYGIYGSLLAVITVITILPQSLSTTLMKFSSELFHENKQTALSTLFQKTTKGFFIVGVGILLLTLLCSSSIMQFLHIANFYLIFFTAVIICLYFLSVVPVNFLQGKLQFGFVSSITALGGIGKFVFGFLFVILGWQVFGALGGVALSVFIPFVIGIIPLRDLLRPNTSKVAIPIKDIFLYALPASISAIALTLFISVDLLLVKHFFSGHEAGLYAGLGFIGKAIFYFTGPIPVVMFPLLVKRQKKNENIHVLFLASLVLVLIPSLCVTIFYVLFPHFVITLFLGGKSYLALTPFLLWYSLFISAFSVLNIIVNFFISLHKTQIVYALVAASIMQIVFISLFHRSFYEIIGISFILTILLIVGLLIYYAKLYATTFTPSFSHHSRV